MDNKNGWGSLLVVLKITIVVCIVMGYFLALEYITNNPINNYFESIEIIKGGK